VTEANCIACILGRPISSRQQKVLPMVAQPKGLFLFCAGLLEVPLFFQLALIVLIQKQLSTFTQADFTSYQRTDLLSWP